MKLKELERASDDIGYFQTLVATKGGRILAVDKRRLEETPFFLLTNPPNNLVVAPAGASSTPVAMRLSGEGPMQMIMLGMHADPPVLVRLYARDGNQPCLLMNNPIHSDTMAGPGGQMYPLPEALYTDEDRALAVVFSDITGESSNVRFTAVGAKYLQLQADPSTERVKQRLKDTQFLSMPYFYTFDKNKASLTAYQSTQFEITISNGHNFEIHQLSYTSDGEFSIDIIDLTKGESIIQAPRGTHYEIPNTLLLGTGSYPYRFHEPVLIFGGQRLLVNLTDLSGDTNEIYLTLGGRAIKIRNWA